MLIRNDIDLASAKQLSLDLNCRPEDFFRRENTVTVPEMKQGRRLLSESPPLFRAATMGMGAVICASREVIPYAQLMAASKTGPEICSAEAVSLLDRELFTYGCSIGVMNTYCLPRTPYRPNVRHEGYRLEIFEGDDLSRIYEDRSFPNALLYKNKGERRDILAVCAINGMRIVGVAGAACDSPTMAQVGIEVLPELRGMGIGAALVSACTAEVFKRGYVPYYGTWCGNLVSLRLACKCGYYPAWCEIFSVPLRLPPEPPKAEEQEQQKETEQENNVQETEKEQETK